MILAKNIKFMHTSFETLKHYPTMFPGDLTIENIPFYHQIGDFPKGLTNDFGQKFEIC